MRSVKKPFGHGLERRFSGPPEGGRGPRRWEVIHSPGASPCSEQRRAGAMDNFQVYFERHFPLVTLILMGDWCSEGCNRNLKEISAKGKDVGDPTFSIYKKKKISCGGEVFPLDRGLLMGDPGFHPAMRRD